MLGIILLTLVAGALAAPMTTPSGPTTTLDLVAVITTAFNTLDADKNGQVDLAEFYKAFDKFDTNDDRVMSLQEYIANTNVSRSLAQLVFKFIDKDHDDNIDRAETNDVFKLYDTNKNGVLTIQEFIREYTRIYDAIIVGLFSTTAPGAATTFDLAAVITATFNIIDADKNGQLDSKEFYAAFDRLDTNGDHKMTLQEYMTNTNVSQSVAQFVFKFMDKNGDGSVDRSEMTIVFNLFDTDTDGEISMQEFIREYTRIYNNVAAGLYPTTAATMATKS